MITEEKPLNITSPFTHIQPRFFSVFSKYLQTQPTIRRFLGEAKRGVLFPLYPSADFRAMPEKRTPDRRLRHTRNYEPSDFFAIRS